MLPIFNTLGFKRFETPQHSRRVAGFALLIARCPGHDLLAGIVDFDREVQMILSHHDRVKDEEIEAVCRQFPDAF